jgi:hypothetical protein
MARDKRDRSARSGKSFAGLLRRTHDLILNLESDDEHAEAKFRAHVHAAPAAYRSAILKALRGCYVADGTRKRRKDAGQPRPHNFTTITRMAKARVAGHAWGRIASDLGRSVSALKSLRKRYREWFQAELAWHQQSEKSPPQEAPNHPAKEYAPEECAEAVKVGADEVWSLDDFTR